MLENIYIFIDPISFFLSILDFHTRIWHPQQVKDILYHFQFSPASKEYFEMSYSAYPTKVIFLIYYDLKQDLKQH
jgi:hypothetical protein